MTSAALEQMAAKYSLGALAYYYKGTGSELNEETMSFDHSRYFTADRSWGSGGGK